MTTLLATIALVVIAIGAMSIGVVMGRRPLQGSCGGVGRCSCGASDPSQCRESAAPEVGHTR